jgi:hypothetical protein
LEESQQRRAINIWLSGFRTLFARNYLRAMQRMPDHCIAIPGNCIISGYLHYSFRMISFNRIEYRPHAWSLPLRTNCYIYEDARKTPGMLKIARTQSCPRRRCRLWGSPETPHSRHDGRVSFHARYDSFVRVGAAGVGIIGIARQPRKVLFKIYVATESIINGIFLIGCGGVKVLTYSERPTNNRFWLPLT